MLQDGTLDGCFTSITDKPYSAGTLSTIVALLQIGKCTDEHTPHEVSPPCTAHTSIGAPPVQTIRQSSNLTPFPEQFKPFPPTLHV